MNLVQASAYLQTLANVVWTISLIGLLAGWTLQRTAERYGRRALARVAPMVCAAIVLALLGLLAKQGVLRTPVIAAVTQPVQSPYCDGWLGWIDARCYY